MSQKTIPKVLTPDFFEEMDEVELVEFIQRNRIMFGGSAVFTHNEKALTCRVIANTTGQKIKGDFKPSHVGSIIFLGGVVYVYNVAPPKPSWEHLSEFILRSKKDKKVDYRIVLRDFALDIDKFSSDIFAQNTNKKYPFFSAAQSAAKIISWQLPWTKDKDKAMHCSEAHVFGLQSQNLFNDVDCNEQTPCDALILLGGDK